MVATCDGETAKCQVIKKKCLRISASRRPRARLTSAELYAEHALENNHDREKPEERAKQ
jgi:hypothetical protein